MSVIAPRDIENSSTISGFNHVTLVRDKRRAVDSVPYQASYGRHDDPSSPRWVGRRRATALEAAQDYCDYVNSGNIIKTPDKLRFVSHPRKPSLGNSAPSTLPRTYQGNEGPGYVYLIGMIGNESAVKIGESKDEPKFRLAGLQTGCPWPLYVLAYIASNERLKVERQLHEKFATLQESTKLVGEWFPKDPSIIQHFEKEGAAA